jgi:hypothetical protein
MGEASTTSTQANAMRCNPIATYSTNKYEECTQISIMIAFFAIESLQGRMTLTEALDIVTVVDDREK